MTVARKYRVAKLPQRQKLNFRLVHFLCDLCAISGGSKASAILLQGMQGVHTIGVRVLHLHNCLTKAERLLRDHCAMTLGFIARLSQECCETYDRTMAARLHCGHCTTSLFVLRVLQICPTILPQPCM